MRSRERSQRIAPSHKGNRLEVLKGDRRGQYSIRIKALSLIKAAFEFKAPGDIDKVIAVADPDTQGYLLVIRDTMTRVSEINTLTWDDVNLEGRHVILYTRKKRGGHLTLRRVPMTLKLADVFAKR